MYTYLFIVLSLAIIGAKGEDQQEDVIIPDNNQDDMSTIDPSQDTTNEQKDDEISQDEDKEDIDNEEDDVMDQGCKRKFPGSCQDIFANNPNSKSGKYTIRTNGRNKRVYCYMDKICGSKGGWTRLAYMDINKCGHKCPRGFRLYKSNDVKACGRAATRYHSCQSVVFPSKGVYYGQVCGFVKAYQKGSTDAVENGLWTPTRYKGPNDPKHHNINKAYVDGISITRGCPRKHVFTLMSGLQDTQNYYNGRFSCPCNYGSKQKVQSFIGNDYYCESGNSGKVSLTKFYTSDPLWDGKGCGVREKKCCKKRGLPYFNKIIGATTSDDLELRICADQGTSDEDVPVSHYAIYVK